MQGRLDLKEEESVKMLCERLSFCRENPGSLSSVSVKMCLSGFVDTKNILSKSQGGTPVYLYFKQNERLILTGQECWIKIR